MGRPSKITQATLAKAAGISNQAVNQSRRVVIGADGTVDVEATAEALQSSKSIYEQIQSQTLRKERALASIREMEEAGKRGELIPLDLAMAVIAESNRAVTQALLSIAPELGDRVAAEDDSAVCAQLIDAALRTALENLPRKITNAVGRAIQAAA